MCNRVRADLYYLPIPSKRFILNPFSKTLQTPPRPRGLTCTARTRHEVFQVKTGPCERYALIWYINKINIYIYDGDSDMKWFDMKWYMIWQDIWYDTKWHYMVWYDVIWYNLIMASYDMRWIQKWHEIIRLENGMTWNDICYDMK